MRLWRTRGPCATIGAVDASRIAAVQALRNLPPNELETLASAMAATEVAAGTRVVALDDLGTAVYFIEQGEAEIVNAGNGTTEVLGPGDTFGEIGLLLTGERTATVVARTELRLLSLSGQDFDRIRTEV